MVSPPNPARAIFPPSAKHQPVATGSIAAWNSFTRRSVRPPRRSLPPPPPSSLRPSPFCSCTCRPAPAPGQHPSPARSVNLHRNRHGVRSGPGSCFLLLNKKRLSPVGPAPAAPRTCPSAAVGTQRTNNPAAHRLFSPLPIGCPGPVAGQPRPPGGLVQHVRTSFNKVSGYHALGAETCFLFLFVLTLSPTGRDVVAAWPLGPSSSFLRRPPGRRMGIV